MAKAKAPAKAQAVAKARAAAQKVAALNRTTIGWIGLGRVGEAMV